MNLKSNRRKPDASDRFLRRQGSDELGIDVYTINTKNVYLRHADTLFCNCKQKKIQVRAQPCILSRAEPDKL